MTLALRQATADDVDTIVGILIASKEASFPDTADDHDRDRAFWTSRWRGYLTRGSAAQQSLGDGWVFLADADGRAVGYIASVAPAVRWRRGVNRTLPTSTTR